MEALSNELSRRLGAVLSDARLDDEEPEMQFRVREFCQSMGHKDDPEAERVVARLLASPLKEADPGPPMLTSGDVAGYSPEFQRRLRRAHAIGATRMAEAAVYNLTSDQLKGLKADLEAARLATNDRIAAATKDWDIGMQKAVMSELDAQLKRVEQQQTGNFRDLMTDAWDKGAGVIPDILARTKMQVSALPSIDPRVLNLTAQVGPELITNITDEVRKGVASLLRQAALGQSSPLDLMKRIGSTTGKGPWRNAFTRGEVIYRTEAGRLFETANFTRIRDMAERDPEWGKEWVSSEDVRVRPTHVRANGQKVKADEHFDVGGYPALYPMDPELPAKESVNCRCLVVPWHPDWEKKKEADEFDLPDENDPEMRRLKAEETQAEMDRGRAEEAMKRAAEEVRRALNQNRSQVSANEAYRQALRAQQDAIVRARNAWSAQNARRRQLTKEWAAKVKDPVATHARMRDAITAAQNANNLNRALTLRLYADELRWRLPLRLRTEGTRPGFGSTRAGGRPRANIVAHQSLWDSFLSISERLEAITGRRSRWSGAVQRGTTPGAAAAFNWQGGLEIGTRYWDIVARLGYVQPGEMPHHLIHEAIHSMSPGLTAPIYQQVGYGWEEAVTEAYAQLLIPKLTGQRALGCTYTGYLTPMEAMRRMLGMDPEKFYRGLADTDVSMRPRQVSDWIDEKWGTAPSTDRELAQRQLLTLDKAMHVSHRQQSFLGSVNIYADPDWAAYFATVKETP